MQPLIVNVETEVERLVLALPPGPMRRRFDRTTRTFTPEYVPAPPMVACPDCGCACAQCAKTPGRFCGLCEDKKGLALYVTVWVSEGDPTRPPGHIFEGTMSAGRQGYRVWMFTEVYWRNDLQIAETG
jgi:hypothetical protein